MKIAIITFDGFNELDSFIALGIINRMRPRGWRVEIVSDKKEIIPFPTLNDSDSKYF